MPQFPRVLSLAVLAALLPAIAPAEPFKDVFPDIYQQVPADLLPGIDALDLKSGTVKLGDGIAEVAVPQDHDFLDAADARFVLKKLWENPDSPTMLGMIFPRR